ncbi:hypothetical protein [Paenibacillus hexagrammi]|uniref:Spore coat protein n=1 Tax=Paenibacillus hexagrammi TaxID=2908839 RepID=A0ABY3SH19_9BACL|nr:hypothetical protein [Paenibacillus sp. YPD9-1]UJF33152.1 hypothetical protein L0M14_27030 [Paenibacillus sp. YPD9-1]
MYNQGNQTISSKELAYIADSIKNEELLTKLCVQGAVECQNSSLKQVLSQLSQERLQNVSTLTNTLQQQAGITH